MVQQGEEDIQTLTCLGLTILQAKIYITIAQLGESSIKQIAKNADIARQNVYEIMPALQKIGLVEKIITSPTVYKATSIKEGVAILLKQKKNEYTRMQNRTQSLLKKFQNKNFEPQKEEETQFIVTSENNLVIKRLERQILTAKTTIDTISTAECCIGMLRSYSNEIKKIMKKGVKVRALTDREINQKRTPTFLISLQKNPLFEIRYTSTPIQIKMTIADKEEINLCIANIANRGLPNMWSNNANFAKLCTGYYDELWKEATP